MAPEKDIMMNQMILDKLKELTIGINSLQKEIEGLKRDIIEVKLKEDKLLEIIDWKKRFDEIISPTQLNSLQKEVESLKQFKTKATTAFVAAQFGVGIIIALVKFI